MVENEKYAQQKCRTAQNVTPPDTQRQRHARITLRDVEASCSRSVPYVLVPRTRRKVSGTREIFVGAKIPGARYREKEHFICTLRLCVWPYGFHCKEKGRMHRTDYPKRPYHDGRVICSVFFHTVRVVLIAWLYSSSFSFRCAWFREFASLPNYADLYAVLHSECSVAKLCYLAPRAINYSGRLWRITDLTKPQLFIEVTYLAQ
jgi:hypothetical protein